MKRRLLYPSSLGGVYQPVEFKKKYSAFLKLLKQIYCKLAKANLHDSLPTVLYRCQELVKSLPFRLIIWLNSQNASNTKDHDPKPNVTLDQGLRQVFTLKTQIQFLDAHNLGEHWRYSAKHIFNVLMFSKTKRTFHFTSNCNVNPSPGISSIFTPDLNYTQPVFFLSI